MEELLELLENLTEQLDKETDRMNRVLEVIESDATISIKKRNGEVNFTGEGYDFDIIYLLMSAIDNRIRAITKTKKDREEMLELIIFTLKGMVELND